MKHKKVVDPLNLMSLSILYGIKHVVPEDIHNTPTEGFFCLTTTLTPLTPPPNPPRQSSFVPNFVEKSLAFETTYPKEIISLEPHQIQKKLINNGRKFVLIRSYISFKAQPKVSPWAYLLIGHAYGGEYLYEILGGILGF